MFDRVYFRMCVVLSFGFVAWILTPLTTQANGGKAKSAYKLEGKVTLDRGDCLFTAQIDPLLFSLTTVGQKYHVIRIQCKNETRKNLNLSDTMDKATVFTSQAGEKIDAVLDLSNVDADAWNSIPMELREKIIYPERVENGEEENLFLFIPVQKIKGMPKQLLLRISSLDKEVILIDPSPISKK